MLSIGLILAASGLGYMWWVDRHQTQDALRRNFPVVARLKAYLPWLSRWFRHNLLDAENATKDKPFSRRDMTYVQQASKGAPTLLSFGTEQSPVAFRFFTKRFAYPATLDKPYLPEPLIIGPNADKPYVARQRIMISALSFGALSAPAVEAISRGAKKFGTLYNVGEGGVAPSALEGGADLILQVGTAKYVIGDDAWNVNDASLGRVRDNPNIKMIEIKMAQGASIGREGGILPGAAMNAAYAAARHRPEGFETIAPNRHTDINSDQELARRIALWRKKTGKPVGIKIALSHSGQWDPFWQYLRDQKALGHTDGIPDFITIDGAEGGSTAGHGAFLLHIGLPIIDALPDLVRSLSRAGLKQQIPIIASGKMATPERVAMAFSLGADMVAVGRGVMFALGCIQAMRCLSRTCPTGITTHNPKLTRGIVPTEKSERVFHYLSKLHLDVNTIAHACGKPCYDQLEREDVGLAKEGFVRQPANTHCETLTEKIPH